MYTLCSTYCKIIRVVIYMPYNINKSFESVCKPVRTFILQIFLNWAIIMSYLTFCISFENTSILNRILKTHEFCPILSEDFFF